MAAVISHRGPDAEGFFCEGPAGLAHRRLSILDLDERANQPMHSACGRYSIILNGEIYNHKEIAAELKINLRTTSDTEVVVEAFAAWGAGFVTRLNGMFVMAILDRKESKMFLYRDRVGIKPLFYSFDGKNLCFASELKSVIVPKIVKDYRKIDNTALNTFLHLGYIPEPMTIWSNVKKFPSGSYAEISSNGFFITTYWDPADYIEEKTITNEQSATDKLEELIHASVRYRLMSDVPYGVFLSGGVDSSLIAAVAAQEAGTRINTFSIGFEESAFNESLYARKVAEHIGSDHQEFIVGERDARDLIPELITMWDEPYGDSSAIPTMLVSKLARNKVTMTLSGDGGDELFHGYGAYNWAERLSRIEVKAFRKLGAAAFSVMSDRHKRVAKLLNYSDSKQIREHIFSQEQYFFSAGEIKSLLSESFYEDNFALPGSDLLKRKLTPAEEQAFFDFRYYLKDDLLVKVDRATMKYSLEDRVPLLDHRIVEFALNVDPALKVKNGVQKYLLKQVLYKYYPPALFDRPKWGFSIPLQKWMHSDLGDYVDALLGENKLQKYTNSTIVADLIKKFRAGQNHLYNRIWLLIVLNNWLEQND